MSRKFLIVLLSLTFGLKTGFAAPPDEGMWLPSLIKQLNIKEMKKLGCKLSAEDIYSTDKPSVKDAIVQLGGFCTAEVVSPQGLLLTNHHCAYDAIQTHSSVDHDYLTDGFWAKNKGEELHTPGLTVSFLQKIVDVTDKIMDAAASVGEADREIKIEETIGAIEAEASEEGIYKAQVKSMFMGNEYYLFVYETFRDIRLVGAPPSSIGKFGGDTDNWMWPRHTGDFSLLRVYAGADNKPADFADSNVPYKPKHFLPVSIKEKKEGDFAMIMGYPGSTDRYLTSYAIKQKYEGDNPDLIKLMDAKLKVMKANMDANDAVRIQLASDYASLANSYKYFLGQNRGLKSRGLIEERQAFEKKFTKWVNSNNDRKKEYGKVLEKIKNNYNSSNDLSRLNNYMNIAGFGSGMVVWGFQFYRLQRMMAANPDESSSWEPVLKMIQAGMEDHFKDYDKKTDMETFAAMTRLYKTDLPKEYHPKVYSESKTFTKAKAKGDMDKFDAYAKTVFEKSFLVDPAKAKAFLEDPSSKVMDKDPGMEYVLSIIDIYRSKLAAGLTIFSSADESLMKSYMKGMREMKADKAFYPDANFTMRLTYGKVIPYDPRDAVAYKSFTSAEGILEKEVPGDEEFDVPAKLKQLIQSKDYGRYGKNGTLVTCFLTDNDITGGNSGSPVINGEGHLIGAAFDGNWESMTSDLVWDDDLVRTISVDSRYILFIIDKFAGAGHLVDEMTVVQ